MQEIEEEKFEKKLGLNTIQKRDKFKQVQQTLMQNNKKAEIYDSIFKRLLKGDKKIKIEKIKSKIKLLSLLGGKLKGKESKSVEVDEKLKKPEKTELPLLRQFAKHQLIYTPRNNEYSQKIKECAKERLSQSNPKQ